MEENSARQQPAEPKPQVEAPKQSRVSDKMKRVAGILNILCFILSLPVLAAGISLLYMRNYDCEGLLRVPEMRLVIGVAMILIFIIINLVIYYGSRCLMLGLLAVMIPLMIMFIVGFALIGAYKIESRAMPDSPMWLKLRIGQSVYWNDIKTCLYDTLTCAELGSRTMGLTSYEFSTEKLSLIESGCCKPPSFCGMQYVNATCWINTRKSKEYQELNYASTSVLGGDCSTWDNAQNKLCYDCEACKQGFLRTLQQRWKRLGIFLVLMAVLLICTHVLIFVANVADKQKT
ncbi:tetraspanin-15-like [Aristolochia californica]|uniref:tetraspanin-15-like n=1 Tax=Aristolochia californica TaxID=171875 RepID=UPI0035DE9F6B